jgi:hypothetical protein
VESIQFGRLGTAAINRPTVPTPCDYDDGEIGGMMIGRGNRSTRRKPAPMPLCPPQTPHAARTRTRAASVGSRRLTASATALGSPYTDYSIPEILSFRTLSIVLVLKNKPRETRRFGNWICFRPHVQWSSDWG